MPIENTDPILAVLSRWQGRPLNFSTLAGQLGISCRSARSRIRALADQGRILLLQPLPAGTGRLSGRAHKSPKLYLGASTRRSCLPPAEAAELRVRTRLIGTLRRLESVRYPHSTFWYHGGYGKNHVELIVQRSKRRIGFVFARDDHLSRWCWSYCRRVLAGGLIHGAFVLYPGRRAFFAAARLVAVPTAEFLQHYGSWMDANLHSCRDALVSMVRHYNRVNAGRIA